MDDSPLVRGLMQLTWDVPVLVFYSVGIVASLVYWRRYPRPCLLALLGCGLLLIATVASPFAAGYFVHVQREQLRLDYLSGWQLPTIAMVGNLVRGGGVGLLVLSVFTARSARQGQDARDGAHGHIPGGLQLGLASVSALLYVVSLYLPAVAVGAPDRDLTLVLRGFECLIHIPPALQYPAWWANPVFAFGVVLLLRGYTIIGGICGLISLLFSLSYFLYLRDFGYNNEPALVGYWFWVAAMLVLAGSLFLPLVCHRSTPQGTCSRANFSA